MFNLEKVLKIFLISAVLAVSADAKVRLGAKDDLDLTIAVVPPIESDSGLTRYGVTLPTARSGETHTYEDKNDNTIYANGRFPLLDWDMYYFGSWGGAQYDAEFCYFAHYNTYLGDSGTDSTKDVRTITPGRSVVLPLGCVGPEKVKVKVESAFESKTLREAIDDGDTGLNLYAVMEPTAEQISDLFTTGSFELQYEVRININNQASTLLSRKAMVKRVTNPQMPKNDNIFDISYNDIPDNRQVVTYLGDWSIYSRDFRFDRINWENIDTVVHAFMGVCSSVGAAEARERFANGEDEFKYAVRFYENNKDTCQGQPDGTLSVADFYAAFKKDLGHGVGDWKVTPSTLGNKYKGVFNEYRLLKEKNPDIKINVSIGGWTLSGGFKDLVDNQDKMDTFLDQLRGFMTKYYYFDGVDIDWEFPKTVEEGEAFVSMLRQVKAVLNNLPLHREDAYPTLFRTDPTNPRFNRLTLSAAVFTPTEKVSLIDYVEASKYLDYIYPMAYDYIGAWGGKLGFQANLHGLPTDDNSAEKAIETLLSAGVPRSKLFMGASAYGRGIKLNTATDIDSFNPLEGNSTIVGPMSSRTGIGSNLKGVMEWYDTYNRFWKGNPNLASTSVDVFLKGTSVGKADSINGFVYLTDTARDSDYFYNAHTLEIFDMDTPRTVFNKAKYAVDNNLKGIFFWTLEYDNGMLIAAANKGLGATLNKNPSGIDMDAQIAIKGTELVHPAYSAPSSAPETVSTMPTEEVGVGTLDGVNIDANGADVRALVDGSMMIKFVPVSGTTDQFYIQCKTVGTNFNNYFAWSSEDTSYISSHDIHLLEDTDLTKRIPFKVVKLEDGFYLQNKFRDETDARFNKWVTVYGNGDVQVTSVIEDKELFVTEPSPLSK